VAVEDHAVCGEVVHARRPDLVRVRLRARVEADVVPPVVVDEHQDEVRLGRGRGGGRKRKRGRRREQERERDQGAHPRREEKQSARARGKGGEAIKADAFRAFIPK